MENYLEYRKCGDVLVPPSLKYKEQYILKCCECNEYFFIVDAFLDHYLAHACESNEKRNSIDIKRKASEEITVTDDPLTTNEDFNDLSDVLKLELDEIAADEVATAPTPNLPKDDNSDSDNNWPECSNEDFNEESEHKYTQDCLEDSKIIIEEGQNSPLQSKSMEEEKPFACDECGSRLKTRKSLKRHKRIHMRVENKEHQCEYCKRIFKKSSSLKNHLRSHRDCYESAESSNEDDDTEDGDWESPASETAKIIKNECSDNDLFAKINVENEGYSIRQETDNQNGASIEKQFSCSECGSQLKTRKSLKRHLRIHLRQPGERILKSTKYECEFCKKVFQQSSSLKDHLRTHTGEQPYLCSECGKGFKSLSNMKQHFLRHGTDRPYECPDCPKKFPCLSDLASHKAVHTKAKSHVCDICGSGFVKPYLLKKHRMYHTGEKNHKCDYCDMRFVLADQCRRHMRTHTGEKPYKCKYCIRAFAQSNDLIKHLRQHLGDNVYKCNMCPKGFRLQGELRSHFNTHKNDDEETKSRNLQALQDDELQIQMKFGLVQASDEAN